jgi:hypothetical protein
MGTDKAKLASREEHPVAYRGVPNVLKARDRIDGIRSAISVGDFDSERNFSGTAHVNRHLVAGDRHEPSSAARTAKELC